MLVKDKDLENTVYEFKLADGSTVSARGNEEIEYDGEIHTAANVIDYSYPHANKLTAMAGISGRCFTMRWRARGEQTKIVAPQ